MRCSGHGWQWIPPLCSSAVAAFHLLLLVFIIIIFFLINHLLAFKFWWGTVFRSFNLSLLVPLGILNLVADHFWQPSELVPTPTLFFIPSSCLGKDLPLALVLTEQSTLTTFTVHGSFNFCIPPVKIGKNHIWLLPGEMENVTAGFVFLSN